MVLHEFNYARGTADVEFHKASVWRATAFPGKLMRISYGIDSCWSVRVKSYWIGVFFTYVLV